MAHDKTREEVRAEALEAFGAEVRDSICKRATLMEARLQIEAKALSVDLDLRGHLPIIRAIAMAGAIHAAADGIQAGVVASNHPSEGLAALAAHAQGIVAGTLLDIALGPFPTEEP